nr:UGT4 [Ginkgo biloba]
MTKQEEQAERPLHAVVMPFPAQGHVNALMNFAKLLASRGFFITFINTDWIENRIFKKPDDAAAVCRRLENEGLRFRFLSIPDNLPPDHGRVAVLDEYFQALQKLAPVVEQLLRNDSEGIPPITFIVSDSFISCTHQVAINLGVPRVVFWTLCAASSIAQRNSRLLISKGYIPVNAKAPKSPENLITCLPGKVPPLWPTDLISFYRNQNALFEILLYESDMANKADYVVVNTFEELEGKETVEGLSNGYPALAVGPVFLANFLEGRGSATSMWEEDPKCLQWLDMQKPASVLYVSFGSVAVKSQEQLQDLALGLEASEQPFLWVIRSDIAGGKSMVLPEGFEDRTKDRALLVGWAPQSKVLSHPSVGGFLTHGGWNSILEAIGMGVPMIGWPYFADQLLNCRFAKDVWKIGLDFDEIYEDENKLVRKEEVEKAVRDLMEGQEGMELRNNILKLKEASAKSVVAGGSSFENLNKFVEDMKIKGGSI